MTEIYVPATGMTGEDVVLVSWMKAPGDAVAAGDVLAIIETSKAEVEVASETSGVMGNRLFEEGATLPPGSTIGHLLSNHVDDPPAERRPHQLSPRQRREAAVAPVGPPDVETPAEMPAAVAPVAAPVNAIPAPPPEPRRAPNPRAAIAAAVSRSWAEIPHFTVTREMDAGVLLEATRQWRLVVASLTVTDLLLRALALSLVDRLQRSDIDLGLAVATDRGVVITVISDVARLDLRQLSVARRAAAERARAGRLIAEDGLPPAATLSNLGALGVDQFTGIVPVGQTALLTVGRAADRPAVRDGALTIASTMQATLNLDHRSWDGYDGAILLGRLAAILSAPALFAAGLDEPATPRKAD